MSHLTLRSKVLPLLFAVLTLVSCGSREKNDPRRITVTGTSEIEVPADRADIRVAVITVDNNIEKAEALNVERVRAVLDLISSFGVAGKDVSTDYVSLQPKEVERENRPPLFQGYEASKTVRIALRDLSRYDELVRTLIKSGVNRIESVSFNSDTIVEKRKEARTLAIRAAREKASALAAELGQSLDSPLTIEERQPAFGGLPNASANFVTRSRSYDAVGDVRAASIAPRTITVTASVEVTFLLKR